MAAPHNVERLVVMQPIKVDTGGDDRDGRLVMANGMLVAILVRLEDEDHEQAGGWFLEASFGKLPCRSAPVFDTLDDATRWLRQRLKS